MSEINKLTVWRTTMKEIIQEYPQKTGENILQQIESRIKNHIEKNILQQIESRIKNHIENEKK